MDFSEGDNKKILVILPYIPKNYSSSFKIFDISYLNKVCTYLNVEKYPLEVFNPNEKCETDRFKAHNIVTKLTRALATKQDFVLDYLNGNVDARLDSIFRRLVNELKLSDNQIVLYYQPYFKDNVYTYLALLREIKRRYGKLKLVCAGTYFFTGGIKTLKRHNFIDFILDWNPGNALLRIARDESIQEIQGIIYRDNTGIRKNPSNLVDFSSESAPNQFMITRFLDVASIEFATGCKYNCFFCIFKEYNPHFQIKEVDMLIREIEQNYARGIKNYWFLDPAINFSEEHLRKFCEKIIEKNIKITWAGPLIPTDMAKSTFGLMRRAGCVHLRISIETVDEEIMQLFGKGVSLNSINRVLINSSKAGIKNTLTFMIGLPMEKPNENIRKIAFVKKNINMINSVKPYIFQLREGAPIFQQPKKFGIKPRNNLNNDNRYVEYDEINGLKWEEIYKRQKINLRQFKNFLSENNVAISIPEEYYLNLIYPKQ